MSTSRSTSRRTSSTLLRSGAYVLVGAVVISTALGFSGQDGLIRVANGVLLLGVLLAVVLLVSGVAMRLVPGRSRR